MNLRHETFIKEMIAHGNRRQAYIAAYPQSSPASAYNNACRLLANPEIRGRIQVAIYTAQQHATEHLQHQYNITLASCLDKRIMLASIIRYHLFPETNSVTGETKKKQPTVSQVLRAIVLDTELEQKMLKLPGNYQ